MNFRKVLVLLLTLCMIVSVMSPAAYAVGGNVIGGADSKGNTSTGVSEVGTNKSEEPLTLREKLLEALKSEETKNTGSLASQALGQLKNETLAELKRAAETFAPSEQVSAFVVLEADPTSEMYADINSVPEGATKEMINTQKALLETIRDRLSAESTLTVRYQFTYLMNAFSITTEFENLAKIAEIPGVRTVFIMPEYTAIPTDETVDSKTVGSAQMTGVNAVWANCGYTGTGMRIAIVDTGLDLDHPAFAEVPELTATSLGMAEIETVLKNLNAYKMMAYQGLDVSAEDLYYSGKVPFAFNYSDWNLNADHESDVQGDHGTHVAGIAAANRIEGVDYAGMAPDAQVIVMKVFGNAGSMMDGVIAALEDALVLDCDVVNMSLGSSAGFTSTSEVIDEVFARVREQDMILAVAAGNEYTSGLMNSWGLHLNTTANPDNGTVDAPGTYINSTVVASVNNSLVESYYFSFGENGAKVGYNNTNGIPPFAMLAELGELEYVFVPGLGNPGDFEGVDVAGKIALVNRGDITFMEKMQNAAIAGAVGVLVVNNEPGSVANFNMDFTGVTEPIVPCVLISMENGAAMAAAEKHVMTVAVEPGFVPDETGGQMSEFSSWGVSPDLRLLPNLAGIGGNVMSTVDPAWTGEGGYYGLMSGTSMATPQVAGVAALVLQYLKQNYPEMDDAQRRVLADALLMSTAVPVVNATTGVESSPRQQGSGLVNAIGAVTSGAYLSVSGDSFGSTKPQIELGDDPDKFGEYRFAFSVNNLTDVEKTYTLSGSLLTEQVYDYYGMKFMDGTDRELTGTIKFSADTVTVPANGSVKVMVTVSLSEEDKAWMDENFENGIYVEGFVYLTAEEGGVDLSLPYMGFYGDWNEAPIFDTGFWYDNSFWFDGAMPTQQQTWNIVWTALGDTDWLLGINPYANVYDESLYDPANNVISPNGDGVLDGIVDIYLSQMRNARTITYTFTDENGIVLSQITDPFCKKTLYMISYNQMVPTVFSWSGYPMYDFTDAEGNVLPDGTKVTLTIEAMTDYNNGGASVNDFNTIEIPITIDTTAPVLENVEQIVYGGRNYVYLTVSDISSLAYVVLANPTGTRYLDAQLDGIHFARNEDNTWNVLLDVTDYGPKMQVILCDYGANEGYYDIEFTAADNMPELEEGTLFGYRIYDSYWSSMGYYDYQYGWQAIDKDTSELTEYTSDYMEYYALTAAEYVDGLVFAVDAGNNLLWMEPGLFNRYQIVNLGEYVIDMTFDDTTDTMYVLYKDSILNGWGEEEEVMVLATMDLLTGALMPLAQYNMYADYYNPNNAPWCITDVNGELYVGLFDSATIAKLNEYFEIVPLMDYKEEDIYLEEPTYYAQSMTYSAADNCIYWAHVASSGTSSLLKIDMTYSEVNDFEMSYIPMPGEAEMVGLFVLEETDYQLPEATAVEQITLDKTEMQLLVGESGVISAAPLPWNAPMGELSWSSSDETVAIVENGVVVGVGNGYADITVTDGVLSATCTVRVIAISGNIYGYNYYAQTEDGQMAYGTWFDLHLGDMDIFATTNSPVDFICADYNGHDGNIYGYNELGQFFSYNPNTGVCEQLGDGIGASNIPRDMAYDYENGIMYAATMGEADGMSVGTLSMVNLSNGALTELQVVMTAEYYGEGWFYEYEMDENGDYVFDEFGNPVMKFYPHAYSAYPSHYENPEFYMTLAWGPDGLYAVTNIGNLVHLQPALMVDYMYGTCEEVLAGEVILEGLGYPMYYQSMAYDHANDKLVWASVENYSIIWMDPYDPAVVSLGLPLGLAMFEFVGMYTIPEVIPERPVIAVESVTAADMTLMEGAVKTSPVTVYPTNATNVTASYTSDNTEAVIVDAAGNIYAVAPGTATITVKVTGEQDSTAETSFTVTVLQGGATINAFLGGDLLDNSSQYWLWFPDYDPSAIDYQNAVYADLFYYSAEYCAETGYVYAYGYDPMDWSSSWYFVTMDPANRWEVVSFIELTNNFPFVYDLTYNYVEGVMYAVADVTDTSSDLYKVDLKTGELLPAMELVNPYTGAEMMVVGLAASPEGKLYAIDNSTVSYEFDWNTWQEVAVVTDAMLYELDPANDAIIPVGPTGFKHASLGSMTFDMDTGNLYWASLYNGSNGYESNFCLIDETTGAAVSLGTPSMAGAQLLGMYIVADSYPERNVELSIVAENKVHGYVGEVIVPTHIVTGAVGPVVWTSGNSDIVAVQEDGTPVAVAPGFTTLTGTVTDAAGETRTVLIGVTVIAQDSYFLAYNNQTNTWEKVDRQNPVKVTPIEGSTTENTLWVSETVNGVIYAYDVEGNFYHIDAATLVATQKGTLDVSIFSKLCDMAYDAANDRMLALIADGEGYVGVYQVDMGSGIVTKLIDLLTYDNYWGEYTGCYSASALTVGLDGTVYVLDESFYPTQDIICQLDMQTGMMTMLNSLNRVSVYTSSNYPQTMITDPLTGLIYLMTTSNGNYYTLTSFDPATDLVATYGTVGETERIDDEWGWSAIVGSTYSTLVSVDAHEHLFVGETETVVDDCEVYEATKQTCLLCGDVVTVVTGHDYKFVETVAPTCTEAGYDLYQCVCGLSKTDNLVPALGHTPGAEADCVNDQICTVCGEVLVYAYGHDMVVNDPTIVCPGTYDATCSVCGETGTTRLRGYHTVYVCEGSGYLYRGTCDICNATLSYSAYARKVATGHNRPETVTDCTAGFDCDVCGQTVVEHSQHCYDRVIVDAQCEVDGSRTYACVRCEAVKEYVVEAHGHVADETAGCTEDRYCVICGEFVSAAPGHVAGPEATCTSDQICVICGEVLNAMIEHSDENGDHFCDGCGLVLSECATEDGDNLCDLCGAKLWEYGDANGDGVVDGKDVMMLRRYMANFDFETGTSAIEVSIGADTNGDGVINGKDVMMLRRYMANYNFATGESTVVLGPSK